LPGGRSTGARWALGKVPDRALSSFLERSSADISSTFLEAPSGIARRRLEAPGSPVSCIAKRIACWSKCAFFYLHMRQHRGNRGACH
jgi:hypothetical protein